MFLSLPPVRDKHIRYQLIDDDPKLAQKVFSTVTESIAQVAVDDSYESALVIYLGHNFSGMHEAAIYYGPGPDCKDKEGFPSEMVRGLSRGGECFDSSIDHYMELVEQFSFEYQNDGSIQ